MDLCHNTSSLQQEERRGEISSAFQILKKAKYESETAAKFLESLMHILRKHKVCPPQQTGTQPIQPGMGSAQLSNAAESAGAGNASTLPRYSEPAMASTPMASSGVSGSNEASSINMLADGFTNGEDLSVYFNEFAQRFDQGMDVGSIDQGMDVGSIDWNNVFSGLDSSFI
ncbi:hypothetical protein BDR22DRAFT_895579 [Usnea florida]